MTERTPRRPAPPLVYRNIPAARRTPDEPDRPAASGAPDRRVYRVAEITREIRSLLERGFGSVWIEGELSNLRRAASGHLYFTVKDDKAQITGVMFRGDQFGLRFQPADGLQVLVHGRISVYDRSGQYQVIVSDMQEAGRGALQAAFEALKRTLDAEGLFDPGRKRPLPKLPRRVGVVTSPTGAAVRDILKVLAGRFANLHVVIAPVRVQGRGAAGEIAAAIATLNRLGGFDALIVGRGGGSLEDLWAFNEEIVARAIAASRIPVISAVGHEIDFTIADFVADVRAATPSHAAELLVESKVTLEAALRHQEQRLAAALRERLLRLRHRVGAAAGSYVFREPLHAVRHGRQTVTHLSARLRGALQERVRRARAELADRQRLLPGLLQGALRLTGQRIDDLALRREQAVRAGLRERSQEARRLADTLRLLNPLAVLTRGYSLTTDAEGRVLRHVADAPPGARIRTRLQDGTIEAEVLPSPAP